MSNSGNIRREEIEDLQDDIARLTAELDDYKEALQRAAAEIGELKQGVVNATVEAGALAVKATARRAVEICQDIFYTYYSPLDDFHNGAGTCAKAISEEFGMDKGE